MSNATPAARSRSRPVPLAPAAGRERASPELPAPLTSFVGREREVAQVRALLRRDDVRLVTLTGPGGVGKTRLALRVAEELAPAFGDGIAFVPLAPVADPALVLSTVAQALGVREAGDEPLAERLQAFLRDKRLLLLLDNFEHLLGAAPLVPELLMACPAPTVLVTSRAALRVSGERVVPVPPLAVPDATKLPPLAELGAAEAVRLFVERAQAAKPDFVLTAENAPVVADICRRLDGLPLAIELAAARVAHLPPAALLQRLVRRLPLLTDGPRDLPERLRALRGAIAWSHDLLTPDEQTLFRRLAVFAGGFSLEAAEALLAGAGDLGLGAFEGVASLVEQSLLRQEEGPDDEPRHGMLETIREFALERLVESGEEAATRGRHAAWCLALAERVAVVAGWGGPEQKRWLDRLEAELPNMRAALAWLEKTGDTGANLTLAGALVGLWFNRGRRAEGRAWLERALAWGGEAPTAARATALRSLGVLERFLGDDRSVAHTAQSLALWRELGDAWRAADALLGLGIELAHRADHARAVPVLNEAAALLDELGEPALAAVARLQLGVAALDRGDGAQAEALLEEVLRVFRREGYQSGVRGTLLALGQAAEGRGNPNAVAARYAEALAVCDELGTHQGLSDALAGVGRLAGVGGGGATAARLLGAAAALDEVLAFEPRPAERARCQRAAAAVRAALGGAGFDAAWAAGRALSPEQAAAEAAELVADLAAPATPATAPSAAERGGLTAREAEVLRLLVEGLSDREIAAALGVSYRTVTSYVRNILAKLDVASRTAAATTAVRRGLV